MSKMSDKAKNLLLLFDRPQVPVFMPKGEEKASFDVPQSYLTDMYKPNAVQLLNRFGNESEEKIPILNISLPPLGDITSLGKHEAFCLFLPWHAKLAGKLTQILMGMRNLDEMLSFAVYARDRCNPYLFNYGLSVAMLHRPDTQGVDVPSLITSFPDKFVSSQVFQRVREQATVVSQEDRTPIEIPMDYTASDLDDDHRVAYFREDIGVNLHHWHWHLVYPFDGARQVVDKNRRGELFYYMHKQMMCRYNSERLCNQLARAERLINWRAPLREGYFPKLDSLVASRSWPSRPPNNLLSNVNRSTDQIIFDIEDMERFRDRIFAAINQGYVEQAGGGRLELDEFTGIDTLGNMVEAVQLLSPNYDFYGNLHNFGHLILAFAHDPDHRFLEPSGIMGDSATAMRDPGFYRWHAYIDDLFENFKSTLRAYTAAELTFPGITIQGVEVVNQGGTKNRINTFWQKSDINLSRGIDFSPRGPVNVRFTHLNHQPFTYRIQVNNTGAGRMATCRIFIAPKFNEQGRSMLFQDQKLLMIELDKFTTTLKPGRNIITQNSNQSSVTIPFERTFRDLDTSRPISGPPLAAFNFCGCGWPEHMLVPKGNSSGFPMELFVMFSDYAQDRVEQDDSGACNNAGSYCGIKDKLYPDRKSMGYPFDRRPRTGVDTLRQFLTPNMVTLDIVIHFTDRTLNPGQRL